MSLFGLRDFATEEDIKRFIVESKNFSPEEDPAAAEALMFFETRKQRTWLVASARRIYCILDDVRKSEPHINWSMGKERIFDGNGRLILPIEAGERDRASGRMGLLHFGPHHRRWLYTKGLFAEPPPDAIARFLRNAMR